MNEKQQNEDRKNQFEGTRRREHELATEANLQLPDLVNTVGRDAGCRKDAAQEPLRLR